MLTGFLSHLPHWYKVEKYEESAFNKNVLQYIFHTVCVANLLGKRGIFMPF